ncbi:MAG: hypothetical protein IJR47_00985, partial [Clostridia bacterium]|nr:hypothetical protein [Clostridia bacterium]
MDRSVLRAKLQLFFELLLRLFLAYLVLGIVYALFINGRFLDFVAYYFGYGIAYAISDYEIPIMIGTFFLGTLFIIYRFISKKVNEANKVYKSFDDILNEDVKSIELPRFFWRYAEKLNSIKYEYVLSQKTAKEAEQKLVRAGASKNESVDIAPTLRKSTVSKVIEDQSIPNYS